MDKKIWFVFYFLKHDFSEFPRIIMGTWKWSRLVEKNLQGDIASTCSFVWPAPGMLVFTFSPTQPQFM